MSYRYSYPHDTIVTPDVDPGRFTPEEAAQFYAGKCQWMVHGSWHSEFCGAPSKPGASFGNCDEHDAELLVEHWPDGTDRDGLDSDPDYAARWSRADEAHRRAAATRGEN